MGRKPYRISTGGEWAGSHKSESQALEAARSLLEENDRHLIFVIKGRLRPELIAVLPESEYERGKKAWDERKPSVWTMGQGTAGGPF